MQKSIQKRTDCHFFEKTDNRNVEYIRELLYFCIFIVLVKTRLLIILRKQREYTNGAPHEDRRREFQKTIMETGANPAKVLDFVPSAYALRLHSIRLPVCLSVLSMSQGL